MNKEDLLTAQLGSTDKFTPRDAITAFTSNDDPKRIGKRTLTNLAQIDLEQIITEENVRTQFDPAKHQELVAQLESMGQLQPIVVWWSEEKSKYIVFMGHRRLRAAPEAGMTSLQCVVLSEAPTDAEKIEKQLAENEGREQLGPMDLSRGFAQIKEIRGCSERDLAASFGVSRSELKRLLSLNTLPADIQQAIVDGKLPKNVAAKIAEHETEEDQFAAFRKYMEEGATYTEIAAETRKTPAKKSPPKKKPSKTVNKSYNTQSDDTVIFQSDRRRSTADIIEGLREVADRLEAKARPKAA